MNTPTDPPPAPRPAGRRRLVRASVSERMARVSPFRQDFTAITRPVLVAPSEVDDVPSGLKLAAGWAWRLMLVAAFIYGLFRTLTFLSEVAIPLFVAILLTAALWPVAEALKKRGVPRGLAVALPMLGVAILVLGIFTLVGAQIAVQWDQLAQASVDSYHQLVNWLINGPLHLKQTQLDKWLATGEQKLSQSQSTIAGLLATAGAQVGHFFAGTAMALFACFYFLYEGRTIAAAASGLVPRRSRPSIMDAAARGWLSLVSYVRAAVIVAAVDGLGAGIGAAIVGSDLFLAIGALTFITAFVPLLGALTAGTVATGVVLVTLGFWKAVIMLVVFVVVMEVEAHVLQPFLLGRAVAIHPLAVLYGLAIGLIIGGIVGGVFTVPLMAFGNAFIKSLRTDLPPDEKPPAEDEFPVDPDDEPTEANDDERRAADRATPTTP